MQSRGEQMKKIYRCENNGSSHKYPMRLKSRNCDKDRGPVS